MKEKYKILQTQLETSDDNASNRSRVSRRTNLNQVKQWIANCEDQTEGAKGLPITDPAAASLEKALNKEEPKTESTKPIEPLVKLGDDQQMSSTVFTRQQQNLATKQKFVGWDQQQQQQQKGAIPKTSPNESRNDEEEKLRKVCPKFTFQAEGNIDDLAPPVAPQGKPTFDPNKNEFAQPSDDTYLQQLQNQFGNLGLGPKDTIPRLGTIPVPLGLPMTNVIPSPSQLAARQVMPRDLPFFSGNPTDWPIFISSYTNTTYACGYSHAENLSRLQRCLKGAAYEAVKSRLLIPASVPQVLNTLQLLYGRPELLINALLDDIRSVPSPKADKLETLIDFGMAVQGLCDHLEAAGQQAHLSNPSLLMELVDKLPAHVKMEWACFLQKFPEVNLKTFGMFMSGIVTSACKVTLYAGGGNKNSLARMKQRGSINTHVDEPEPQREPERSCYVCQRSGHRVQDCGTFKSLSVDDRWKCVQNNALCRNCLNSHGRRSCRIASQCEIDGCQFRHHPLLHSSRVNRSPNSTPLRSTESAANHTHRTSMQSLLFRIVPVTLYGPRSAVTTFAFLDDGSSLTLIEESLVKELGVGGRKVPLCLTWTGNVTRMESGSKQVQMTISGVDNTKQFQLEDVRTVKELALPGQSLDFGSLVDQYQHLRGLPVASYENAVPRLLVGINNLKLTVPLKVKEGGSHTPVAMKTRLGWCVYGGKGGDRALPSLNYHSCDCARDYELHNTVKEFFEVEDVGVKSVQNLESKEEQRARRILELTTVRKGERFETGLLWRFDAIEFPDSYNMALRRLECLERRMNRDPFLKENLQNQLIAYQENGYAHRASREELGNSDPRRVWYLPLGAVTNPRKPEKVRIIWDAAATVNGISLNSLLLKGPDQLTCLPAVMSRFRQYSVGVSADIKEMFHQISIRAEDRHSQWFLWRTDRKTHV